MKRDMFFRILSSPSITPAAVFCSAMNSLLEMRKNSKGEDYDEELLPSPNTVGHSREEVPTADEPQREPVGLHVEEVVVEWEVLEDVPTARWMAF